MIAGTFTQRKTLTKKIIKRFEPALTKGKIYMYARVLEELDSHTYIYRRWAIFLIGVKLSG